MSVGDHNDEMFAGRARAPSTKGLSTSAAHEINNPLDTLLNLLYLVESDPAISETSREYLKLAQEEVRRISEIAHASLGQPDGQASAENANVGELLHAVVDFYKCRFEQSGIEVETRYGSDGHVPIFSGPLREVFANLLLNAQAATPEGGRVHARVCPAHEWSGKGRHGVRVTVADNGSGIAANLLPRIFQPFFTTKPAGHGMGLSLVRDIVQQHEGSLRVRSSTKAGQSGTVFAIFLPAASPSG
jgi:signal transduction histidine kinase